MVLLLRPFITSAPARAFRTSSILSIRPLAMPLRAKIAKPAFARSMSSSSSSKEPDDVLFNSIFGLRTIELNRPSKLNALNGSMVSKIAPRLQEWEKSQLANIIVIKGSGDRAFCAGGDVSTLAENNTKGPEGIKKSIDFFGEEYKLNHLIATYTKPYVAFMDGHTMGGGVGLSVHAPFRIATERTNFAMPETTIGFFPDVGGSFFLPRLDGEIGTYLALTSARLTGIHTLYAGIATHYLHSSSLPELEERLAELRFPDNATMAKRNEIVNHTIEEFSSGLPANEPFVLAGETRRAIDRCFGFDSVDEILAALAAEGGTPWAEKTIKTLHARSPTAVRVALKQMRAGTGWSIGDTFQREYHIAAKFMEHPDFVEGVTALLGKPSRPPVWTPPTIEDCPPAVVDSFFIIPEGAERLTMLNEGAEDYVEYPHVRFGLPRERWIRRVIESNTMLTLADLVTAVGSEYRGKPGVREKVLDVVERRCRKDEGGFLRWGLST